MMAYWYAQHGGNCDECPGQEAKNRNPLACTCMASTQDEEEAPERDERPASSYGCPALKRVGSEEILPHIRTGKWRQVTKVDGLCTPPDERRPEQRDDEETG